MPGMIRVSNRLPESLKPTRATSPHHAVDVSFWVKPARREKARSVFGSETAPKTRTGPSTGAVFVAGTEGRATTPAPSSSAESRSMPPGRLGSSPDAFTRASRLRLAPERRSRYFSGIRFRTAFSLSFCAL